MVCRCTNLLCFNAGFQSSFSHFAFYFMNIVLTSLAGCSVALVFSASTQQHSIGTILTALIWVCMMVFSGLLVKVSTVPQFLQWIKWFSIFRYSMNVSSPPPNQLCIIQNKNIVTAIRSWSSFDVMPQLFPMQQMMTVNHS